MEIKNCGFFYDYLKNCRLDISSDNGFVVTDHIWKRPVHQVHFSRLYYIMDGSGVFVCEDGKEIPIEAGYAYFAPCGARYGYYGTDSVTKLFFHINLILPDGYDFFSSPEAQILKFEKPLALMKNMLDCYRSEDISKQIFLQSEILRTVSDAAMLLKSGKRTVNYSKTVSDAIGFIRKNLSASLKVSEVADAVFCSRDSLLDRFKSEMGISVSKYIEDLLMFEASHLLMVDKKTVGEVSSEHGYCDQFYFSRRFTKHFSISPKDYKKL